MTAKNASDENRNSIKINGKAIAAYLGVATTCLVNANDVTADIVYSGPLNIELTPGSYYNNMPGNYDPGAAAFFDFDDDGNSDLGMLIKTGFGGGGPNTSFAARGQSGYAVVLGDPADNNPANRFLPGDPISGDNIDGLGWLGWYRQGMGIDSDPWGALQAGIDDQSPVDGFVGFRIEAGELNGWMQISLEANQFGQPTKLTIIDWAYEDSGEEILAGDVGEKGGGMLGDVNCDGDVNLLDVAPFVDLILSSEFSEKADINDDGAVDLLDVAPFVELLTG